VAEVRRSSRPGAARPRLRTEIASTTPEWAPRGCSWCSPASQRGVVWVPLRVDRRSGDPGEVQPRQRGVLHVRRHGEHHQSHARRSASSPGSAAPRRTASPTITGRTGLAGGSVRRVSLNRTRRAAHRSGPVSFPVEGSQITLLRELHRAQNDSLRYIPTVASQRGIPTWHGLIDPDVLEHSTVAEGHGDGLARRRRLARPALQSGWSCQRC